MSDGLILGAVGLILLFGWIRRVNLYEAFIAGAREGLQSAVSILPNLTVMLLGVQLMRASGLLAGLETAVQPLLKVVGLPAEVAPLLLLRPLSGSGSLAVLTELLQTWGADSRVGLIASTLMGSSETIVDTLGIYAGAGKVNGFRYALPVALCAWAAACVAAGMLFG